MKQLSSVAQKQVYQGVSNKSDVLKVDIKKIFSDVIQFWKSAKAAETEDKEHEVTWGHVENKEKGLVKNLKIFKLRRRLY